MNIAIIPARIGSKRIKEKNLKKFCNKPAIYWTIKELKKTKLFEKIIVSTDSIKLANLAKFYGAEVPFMRPKKLAGDFVSTSDVVRHAIKWLDKNKIQSKYVCCAYPCAVFIDSKDIKKGYTQLKKKKSEYVFSAASVAESIYRSFYFKKNHLKMMFPKNYDYRTQDLTNLFIDAGQFYWGLKDTWLNKNKIFTKESSIVNIPRYKYVDIDTIEDWKFAEKLAKINTKF
tara:strand:- start:361 stop:1047 length:687 start_codon:yes stop_codon:yes gene_type:complete